MKDDLVNKSGDLVNDLVNDCISRQAAIKAADSIIERDTSGNNDVVKAMTAWQEYIKALPSAQPDHIGEVTEMVGDVISRAAVLNLIEQSCCDLEFDCDNVALRKEVEALPSAQPEPEEFEWCHTCREYDQEKHCCHRWTKVIRKTVDDMKAAQRGWIPTSERLPDNDRAVLVTLKWAEDDYEVAVGEYWHNSTASHGWGSFEGHVIAWHELPTPYREGGHDGET